jgi:hypothetical protein
MEAGILWPELLEAELVTASQGKHMISLFFIIKTAHLQLFVFSKETAPAPIPHHFLTPA